MSTRAIIARPTDAGWEGVYSHFDGYPTGLGKKLHTGCREQFGGDVDAMLRFIIDDHLGGWSTLGNLDATKAAGYTDTRPDFATPDEDPVQAAIYKAHVEAPRCYCHSERPGDAGDDLRTHEDAKDAYDIEWTYICSPEHLMVFKGCFEMTPVGSVEWDAEVSDERWGTIECGENYERCTHYAWVHFPDLPAEYRDMSMDLLMGARKPEPHDAIGYMVNGVEVKCRKSGHAESYYAECGLADNGERRGGTRWFGEVEYPDGNRKYVPLYSQKTKRFCAGVTPIYPPTLAEMRQKV